MSGLIDQILKMSLTGAIVIAVILVVRFLMRKLPRKSVYMLWAVVGFRLLCPFSIESRFSLFNLRPTQKVTSQIPDAGVPREHIYSAPAANGGMVHQVSDVGAASHHAVHPDVTHAVAVADKASHIAVPDTQTILFALWALVAVAIVGYALYHLIKLRIKCRGARQVEKGIYESSDVVSPFAMGILRPAIYLPEDLSAGERQYLIEHERTHIRRGDLFFKMIAVTAFAIHWFNPLVWIAYFLFCTDMEMSCDEIVLEKLGDGIRRDYSLSLVSMASKTNDRSYVVLPTSFSKGAAGKNEVKMRIKNIMSFKKRSRSIAVLASLIVLVVSATCVLNACSSDNEPVVETTAETEITTISTDDVTEVTSTSLSQPDGDFTRVEFFLDNYTDWESVESDDVREVAQSYADVGYNMMYTDVKLYYDDGTNYLYTPVSDIRYIDYPYGDAVRANFMDGENCIDNYVYILEGDEDVYNWIVDSYGRYIVDTTVEDDGDLITTTLYGYSYEDTYTNYYICFDRNSGIVTVTEEVVFDHNISGPSIYPCSEDEHFSILCSWTDRFELLGVTDDGTVITYTYNANDGYSDYTMIAEYHRDTQVLVTWNKYDS